MIDKQWVENLEETNMFLSVQIEILINEVKKLETELDEIKSKK